MQEILSIQLPPNDDLSPYDDDVEEDYRIMLRHKHNKNPSNDSKPSNDTEYTEAYVDAGELVLLDKNLTNMHSQDVLTSLLFAQLAANFKYNRTGDVKKWSNYYGQILGQVGWVLEKSYFRRIEIDDFFIVSDFIIKLFEKDFSGIDKDTFKYLGQFLNRFDEVQLEDDVTVDMFYNITNDKSSVSFAVTLTSEDGEGSLQMYTIQVSFKAQCEMSKAYLFYLLDSECVGGGINVGVSQYLLNKAVFSKSRDVIVKRLGSRIEHYVVKMKLN